MRRFKILLVLLIFIVPLGTLYAADPMADIPVLDRNFDTEERGFKLGVFNVIPTLSNAIEYRSNVFSSADNAQSDKIFKNQLAVSANNQRNRTNIEIFGSVQHLKYAENDDLDRLAYKGVITHSYKFTPNTKLGVGVNASKSFESRYDVGSSTILNDMVAVNHYGIFANSEFEASLLDWNVHLTYQDVSYDNVSSMKTGETVIQDDRDKSVYTLEAKASFSQFSDLSDPGFTPFIGFRLKRDVYDKRDFVEGANSYSGIDQSNTRYNILAGIDMSSGGKLRGSVAAGYGYYTPDDRAVESQSTGVVDIDLVYLYTPLTNLIFEADRFFTTDTEVTNSVIETRLSGRVVHELTRQWILSAGVGYQYREFGDDIHDDSWSGIVGASYDINEKFSVSGNVDFIARDSNRGDGDYNETRAMIRLNSKF